MTLRYLGALFLVLGCVACGIISSNLQRKQIHSLEELIHILDTLSCELEYKRSAIPELCRQVVSGRSSPVSGFFDKLADEIDAQVSPNIKSCACAVLEKCDDIPLITQKILRLLGDSLGQFDVEGELLCLQNVRSYAFIYLEDLRQNHKEKNKTNQTIWVCAGVLAAVLMI